MGGRNRRRVDRGARRGPGARRVARGALAAGLALVAAIGGVAGWRALARAHAFSIQTVRFQGLGRATADELLALSPVKPGDDLLGADVDAVEAALARHPWVARVVVHRRWPPALDVAVVERRAAAVVELSGLYLVDEEANVFKRAAPGDGLDLPIVTGLARNDWLQRRAAVQPMLLGALALARAWRTGGRDEAAPLSEIHLDPGDGTTIYVGDDGIQVRLGTGDLEAKLARLEQVLAALRAEGRKAEVLHLDNRLHPSWVAVRLAGAEQPPPGGGGR